jgi:hypothetical protein
MSLERAAILMVLMRELEGIGRAEVAVLRQLRPGRLRDLRAEKAALGEALEIELGRLRRSPEVVGALEPEAREALEAAMRRYRSATWADARRLLAARRAMDDVARELDASLAATTGPAETAHDGAAPAACEAQVLAFALRRRSAPAEQAPGRAGMFPAAAVAV